MISTSQAWPSCVTTWIPRAVCLPGQLGPHQPLAAIPPAARLVGTAAAILPSIIAGQLLELKGDQCKLSGALLYDNGELPVLYACLASSNRNDPLQKSLLWLDGGGSPSSCHVTLHHC